MYKKIFSKRVPSAGRLGQLIAALALLAAPVAHAQTVKVGAVNLAQSHVMNADSDPDPLDIVGERDLLFKANFVASEPGVDPARVFAELTLFAADGQNTTLSLQAPRSLASLPAAFDNHPGTVEHSFDDSHTAIIPAPWVKPGLRWQLHWDLDGGSGAGGQSHMLDSGPLDVRPPASLLLTVIDVQWFDAEVPFDDFPQGYFDEIEQKMPASRLELRRAAQNHFPRVAMPAKSGRPPRIVESLADWQANIGDGEANRSRRWANELQQAAGASYRDVANFCVVNHGGVASGGSSKDTYHCSSERDDGIYWQYLGQSFKLRKWSGTDDYPYKDPDPSDGIPYDTYLGVSTGQARHNTHVGPYWAFDARGGGTFLSPRIDDNGSPRWKASPMQSGGQVDAPPGMHLGHLSDFAIHRINGVLDSKRRWLDADNAWLDDAYWLENGPGWYELSETSGTGYQVAPGDGLDHPIGRDLDVYSILLAASMASNDGAEPFALIYPPIGPYRSNVRTLFDPRQAEDLAAMNGAGYCPSRGCDLSLRVRQAGEGFEDQVYVLAEYWDTSRSFSQSGAFFETAINLPASQGAILGVELLHTPDVAYQGWPSDPEVLAAYGAESGPAYYLSDRDIHSLGGFSQQVSNDTWKTVHFSCPQRSVISRIDAGDDAGIGSVRLGCAPLLNSGHLGATVMQEELGYLAEFGPMLGSEATLDCAGRMVTGVRGRHGESITQIGAFCSDILQVLDGEYENGLAEPVGSGVDGSPIERRCAPGFAVTGAKIQLDSGTDVLDDFQLLCSRVDVLDSLADEDLDGHLNAADSCPFNANEDQLLDWDGDGIGDACDRNQPTLRKAGGSGCAEGSPECSAPTLYFDPPLENFTTFLPEGRNYIPPKVTCFDGDVQLGVYQEGPPVDPDRHGEYSRTFSCIDSDGNSATQTLTVNVYQTYGSCKYQDTASSVLWTPSDDYQVNTYDFRDSNPATYFYLGTDESLTLQFDPDRLPSFRSHFDKIEVMFDQGFELRFIECFPHFDAACIKEFTYTSTNTPTREDLFITPTLEGSNQIFDVPAFAIRPTSGSDLKLYEFNILQKCVDTDGDGEADWDDLDNDGDGVYNHLDDRPLDPTETVDSDGDGIGDNADTDSPLSPYQLGHGVGRVLAGLCGGTDPHECDALPALKYLPVTVRSMDASAHFEHWYNYLTGPTYLHDDFKCTASDGSEQNCLNSDETVVEAFLTDTIDFAGVSWDPEEHYAVASCIEDGGCYDWDVLFRGPSYQGPAGVTRSHIFKPRNGCILDASQHHMNLWDRALCSIDPWFRRDELEDMLPIVTLPTTPEGRLIDAYAVFSCARGTNLDQFQASVLDGSAALPTVDPSFDCGLDEDTMNYLASQMQSLGSAWSEIAVDGLYMVGQGLAFEALTGGVGYLFAGAAEITGASEAGIKLAKQIGVSLARTSINGYFLVSAARALPECNGDQDCEILATIQLAMSLASMGEVATDFQAGKAAASDYLRSQNPDLDLMTPLLAGMEDGYRDNGGTGNLFPEGSEYTPEGPLAERPRGCP